MESPIVSVILPVRDAERTIDQALDSVLRQTFTEFELIAIDDGSTDGTGARLRNAAATDSRIRVIGASGRGTTAALISGLRVARGRYLARQDADDLSMPDRLARQVGYLDTHPAICAVGTAAVTIDGDGREIGAFPTRHGVDAVREGVRSIRATPVHGSMLMRAECLAAVGGYRAAFLRCQDFDLWLRLLERWDIDNLKEPLYKWRLSGASLSGERRENQLLYGGIAAAFARERQQGAGDSYAVLEAAGDDLEAFAREFRLQGFLRATWGELLLRGVDDSRLAHQHFSHALRAGNVHPRTVFLWVWTRLGLPWMGGKTLRALMSHSQQATQGVRQ